MSQTLNMEVQVRWMIPFLTLVFGLTIQAREPDRDCNEVRKAQAQLRELRDRLAKGEDLMAGYEAFNVTGIKLRTLARNQRCGLRLEDRDQTLVVHYGLIPSGVREERFVLVDEYKIARWIRVGQKGEITSTLFGANGSALPNSYGL